MTPAEISALRAKLGLSASDMATIFELADGDLEKIEAGELAPSKTMVMMLGLFKGLGSRDASLLALRLRDAAIAARKNQGF